MQVVVEDDTDGEALVTFSCVQLHSLMFSYIQLHAVPFNSIQLHVVPFRSVQLTTQLEAVKLSELVGAHG